MKKVYIQPDTFLVDLNGEILMIPGGVSPHPGDPVQERRPIQTLKYL